MIWSMRTGRRYPLECARAALAHIVGRATLPDIGPLKMRLRLMKRPVSGKYARPTGHVILRAKSDSTVGRVHDVQQLIVFSMVSLLLARSTEVFRFNRKN
jgi:hypothetical protein